MKGFCNLCSVHLLREQKNLEMTPVGVQGEDVCRLVGGRGVALLIQHM